MQCYSDLCANSVAPSSRTAYFNQGHGLHLYSQGLTAAADMQQKAVKAGTLRVSSQAVTKLARLALVLKEDTQQAAMPGDIL